MKLFICVAFCILLIAGIGYCDNDARKEMIITEKIFEAAERIIAKPLKGIERFAVIGFYHINDAAKNDKYKYNRETGRAFAESIVKNRLVENNMYAATEVNTPLLEITVDSFFVKQNTYVYHVTLRVLSNVILPAEPDKLYWSAIVWSKNTEMKSVTASNQDEFLKKVAPDIEMLTSEFIKSYKIANPVIKKSE